MVGKSWTWHSQSQKELGALFSLLLPSSQLGSQGELLTTVAQGGVCSGCSYSLESLVWPQGDGLGSGGQTDTMLGTLGPGFKAGVLTPGVTNGRRRKTNIFWASTVTCFLM